jgi:hypothetical protein
MSDDSDVIEISSPSQRKVEANRRNAQLSTGPKTQEGKCQSRLNALKHSILASDLLITEGQGAEDGAKFYELLDALRSDLAPVGALEEILVERIAVSLWRQKRAHRCEAGLVRRRYVPNKKIFNDLNTGSVFGPNPELESIKDHLSLPVGSDLEHILRYEASIQRQLAYAISQLERLQRSRKGEHVPAPVTIQVSSNQ